MQVDSPSLGRQDSFPAGSPQGPPNLCCAPRQAVPPPTRARSCGLGVLRAPHPPRTTCPAQPKRKLRARLCDLPRATQRRSETGRLHGLGLWAPDCWRVSPGQAAAPEEGHPRSGGCTQGGSPPGRAAAPEEGPPQAGRCTPRRVTPRQAAALVWAAGRTRAPCAAQTRSHCEQARRAQMCKRLPRALPPLCELQLRP